jgi:glycosyltransferase involved in cell wall biosynthesis
MRIGLIVRGGVEADAGAPNPAPIFIDLIRRLAAACEVKVFSLHGANRATVLSLYRGTAPIHRIGDAAVIQLGTAPMPRLRLAADALRVGAAIRALAPRSGRPELLHGIGLSPGIVATAVGRLSRIPSVVSLVGGELTCMPEIAYGDRRSAKGRAIVTALLRTAGTITVASEFMRRRAEGEGARARVLPFGIDVDRFAGDVARPDGPPYRLLHVGTLCALKDQLTLVRALRLLVERGLDVTLDIAGSDDWGGRVQREWERLGLGARVTWHGWRDRDALAPLHRRAHAFVMTSLDDVAPAAVLEAAAAGLPVVGTNVGFIADWAPERAIATPIADARALADAVQGLLADRPARERLAARAQDWVRRNASLAADDAFLGLYRELILRGQPRRSPC